MCTDAISIAIQANAQDVPPNAPQSQTRESFCLDARTVRVFGLVSDPRASGYSTSTDAPTSVAPMMYGMGLTARTFGLVAGRGAV